MHQQPSTALMLPKYCLPLLGTCTWILDMSPPEVSAEPGSAVPSSQRTPLAATYSECKCTSPAEDRSVRALDSASRR